MEKIILKEISKVYSNDKNTYTALDNINLNINEGELVAIMGRSGSGKTTLLNILGGLIQSTKGTYFFDGHELKNDENSMSNHRNKNIGFIVQDYALIKDITVFENIKLPLKYNKLKKEDIIRRIDTALTEVGLLEKKMKLPTELSGGECQRVAIARALINNANVILADEPTGALDEKTEELIMDLFVKLNNRGKTILIVTHDNSIAHKCNRIIKIKDGKIE